MGKAAICYRVCCWLDLTDHAALLYGWRWRNRVLDLICRRGKPCIIMTSQISEVYSHMFLKVIQAC